MEMYNVKIYDTNMRELARLQNAYNISYELKLNELWTCAFSLPKEDKKNIYCQPYNYVELFDGNRRIELFRILPQVLTRDENAEIRYECEHVLATLIDDVLFKYHQIGNMGVYTDRVIRYVLDHQNTKNWNLIECDFERQFEYKWENENLLSALFSIPKCFKEKYIWKFDTTKYPWGISLKRLEENYKADIQYKKNMQNIEKTIDPTTLVTRLYLLGYGEGDNQLDVTSINNNLPYIEKNVGKYGLKSSILVDRRFESPETLMAYGQTVLNDLSEPYVNYKVHAVDLNILNHKKYAPFVPGDMVLIRDVEDNINVILPIVSVQKSDTTSNPFDIDIEIANKNKDITGSISDLVERSRINDTYAQGATNLQQIAYADNADRKHPLHIKFYIPNEMARINKLILNYTLEPFRAYSKAIKGGGGTTTTTGSGGGTYTTTGSGGGSYATTSWEGGQSKTSESQGRYYGRGGHNHGIPDGTTFKDIDGRWYTWVESGNHDHEFAISGHEHSVEIDPHEHSLNIDSHDHSINLLDHTHDIEYGIFEGGTANSAYLKVDGNTVYNYSKEVNIIPYLSKDSSGKIERGTWHTVEIVPDGLTRINASLFIQLFTNSRGGGDY